jgi:hypothetical protein
MSKISKKRRTHYKKSKNRHNTRKGGMRILGPGERHMLSVEPQIETSRQRRSTLTPRQRHLVPIQPALISSRTRRRPVSAYSMFAPAIPTQTIPERLPNITNKKQFIETKDMLIGILNDMMKMGNETPYNYEIGVPHIILLLAALRLKLFNINLGDEEVIVETEITIAIQNARRWINQQNMPEQDYSESY